jgi:hypothetical protein
LCENDPRFSNGLIEAGREMVGFGVYDVTTIGLVYAVPERGVRVAEQ